MTVINTYDALRKIIGDKVDALEAKVVDHVDEFAREFIEKAPFLILSTSDAEGNCDASPKGDAPGFVEIVDDKTILIPDRPGNKLAYGHENVLANPHVGLLFMIPGTTETLRINGRAELDASEPLREQLAARGKPATLVIRVTVDQCFFHCSKAFLRSGLWKPDTWAEKPHTVSFGTIYAKKANLPEEAGKALDDAIEADYRDNL
ncbi:MAG: pyridoxamine 5'-phosphate oxidase family protein [Pseudomonadales bacterium]|nr:pyridoxamine 5'-phosphate oxidase family protein [Pseudomonadales bacterium]